MQTKQILSFWGLVKKHWDKLSIRKSGNAFIRSEVRGFSSFPILIEVQSALFSLLGVVS